ncbi:MAG: lasso peptide biosynthesis protein, partial [Anaerolineae bacterium]|nr:lasso peptide biosynthesis protein [Anaerolineae bacterium]
EAHAWVVWQGAVLNDSPDVAQRYTPLDLAARIPLQTRIVE